MEEKRNLKVMFARSGSGSITPRITVPKSFTDFLEVTQEDREVVMELDKENKRIIITKK